MKHLCTKAQPSPRMAADSGLSRPNTWLVVEFWWERCTRLIIDPESLRRKHRTTDGPELVARWVLLE